MGPTLSEGSTGAAVVQMQQQLRGRGFYVEVDGEFGEKTKVALEQFQASVNLTMDGVCGPDTWRALLSRQVFVSPDVKEGRRSELLSMLDEDLDLRMDVREVMKVAISAYGFEEDIPNGGKAIGEIVEGPGGDGLPPSAYYLHIGVKDKATLREMPPWCALFTCWAFRKGLAVDSWKQIPYGDWFGGVAQVEAWAKKKDIFSADLKTEWPVGVLFTQSRGNSGSDKTSSVKAGHIGFVVKDHGDGTITTIEGNVGNAVGSYRRKKSGLRGYIVWW